MILSTSTAHAQPYEECQAQVNGVVSSLKLCDTNGPKF